MFDWVINMRLNALWSWIKFFINCLNFIILSAFYKQVLIYLRLTLMMKKSKKFIENLIHLTFTNLIHWSHLFNLILLSVSWKVLKQSESFIFSLHEISNIYNKLFLLLLVYCISLFNTPQRNTCCNHVFPDFVAQNIPIFITVGVTNCQLVLVFRVLLLYWYFSKLRSNIYHNKIYWY